MIFLSDPNTKVFQIFSLLVYSVVTSMWVLFLLLDFSSEMLFAFILGSGFFGFIIFLNLKRKQVIVQAEKINIDGLFTSISLPLMEVEKITSTLIAPPFYKIILKDGRFFYFSVNKELSFKLSLKLGDDLIVNELNRFLISSKPS